jgi:hypothetical protein
MMMMMMMMMCGEVSRMKVSGGDRRTRKRLASVSPSTLQVLHDLIWNRTRVPATNRQNFVTSSDVHNLSKVSDHHFVIFIR